MNPVRSLPAAALCTLLCACQSTALIDTAEVRVSAHYTASGAVGLAKAFVYADRTVVELDTSADAAIATNHLGKLYRTSIDGRYIRFEGVEQEIRLHSGGRAINFTLSPGAKVFSASGVTLAPFP